MTKVTNKGMSGMAMAVTIYLAIGTLLKISNNNKAENNGLRLPKIANKI